MVERRVKYMREEEKMGPKLPAFDEARRGGFYTTTLRNRLTMEVFEALQILKSAYRNGHIAATEQASQHLNALITSLSAVDSASEGIDSI